MRASPSGIRFLRLGASDCIVARLHADCSAATRGLGHSCGNRSISLQTETKRCGIFTEVAEPGRAELFQAAADHHLRHFHLHVRVASKLLASDMVPACETEREGSIEALFAMSPSASYEASRFAVAAGYAALLYVGFRCLRRYME